MTRTATTWPTQPTQPSATAFVAGHEARDGFCAVCGSVAPCYRARRSAARRAAGLDVR